MLPLQKPRCLFSLTVVVLLLPAAGCLHTTYKIEMRPDGEELQRKITATSSSNTTEQKFSVSQDELNILASAYQRPVPEEGLNPTTFEGEFTRETPDDVGGHGYFLHWESTLGTTSAYLERFRGSDDFFRQLQRRREAIDQMVNLLLGWMDKELAALTDFSKLRAFVDGQFRHDLQNMGVYMWQAQTSRDENHIAETMARLGLYLAERGYVDPEHITQFVSLNHVDRTVAEERILSLLKGVIGRKTELNTTDIETQFPFLQSLDRIEASWKAFIRTTPEFKNFARNREKQDSETRLEDDFWGELLLDGFFGGEISFLSSSDHVNSSLYSGTQPMFTNGKWDAQTQVIQWSFPIPLRDSKNQQNPDFCYAIWSQPHQASQFKHFGKVILDEESLGQYCLWYQSLDENQKTLWNGIVSQLDGGQSLVKQIRDARTRIKDSTARQALESGLDMIDKQFRESTSDKD